MMGIDSNAIHNQPLLSALKIGYVPLNADLISAPGDYRRFVGYANFKGFGFEIADRNKIYDLVVVSQGADITYWRDYSHGVIVYDFVDSYLSIPYTNIRGLLRGIHKFITRKHVKLEWNYWNTLKKMCSSSDAVICSTKFQKDKILPYCNNTHVILDIQDSVVKRVKGRYEITDTFKIVWEGLPCNLYQLKAVAKSLNRLSKKYNIELHIITDPLIPSPIGSFFDINTSLRINKIFHKTVFHEWNKDTVAKIICSCDVAIIPVDTKYALTNGKPENKLLLLWRMGIPVVASDTPVYSLIMKKVGLNLICKNSDDWFEKIQSLIASSKYREQVAKLGKGYAEKYSDSSLLIREWDALFQSLNFNTDSI